MRCVLFLWRDTIDFSKNMEYSFIKDTTVQNMIHILEAFAKGVTECVGGDYRLSIYIRRRLLAWRETKNLV